MEEEDDPEYSPEYNGSFSKIGFPIKDTSRSLKILIEFYEKWLNRLNEGYIRDGSYIDNIPSAEGYYVKSDTIPVEYQKQHKKSKKALQKLLKKMKKMLKREIERWDEISDEELELTKKNIEFRRKRLKL
jgi:hypothetical protein